MNITSLIYIKNMLEHEIETRERSVRKLKDLLEERYVENDWNWRTPDDKVNGNVLALRAMLETQRDMLRKAQDVFEDLMRKEWN